MAQIPRFIDEKLVKSVLKWPPVIEAVEEGIRAASAMPEPQTATSNCSNKNPYAIQPARTLTEAGYNTCNILYTMPGFVADWELSPRERKKKCSAQSKLRTLACKVVTSFPNNENCESPLPRIMANVLFFNADNGRLECVIEANTLTAWRTAAASVVATRYLYFRRFGKAENRIINVAIIGCGVEGYHHALAMLDTFCINTLYLWNRSPEVAECMAKKLCPYAPDVNLRIGLSVETTVSDADVICMCTSACEPLLTTEMIKKPSVHINAVGGFGEVAEDVYAKSSIYTDSKANAAGELKELKSPIVAELGEVIINMSYPPIPGTTIFQSLGMASEDATVAHFVYNAYK